MTKTEPLNKSENISATDTKETLTPQMLVSPIRICSDLWKIEKCNCIGSEIGADKYGDNPEAWTDRVRFDTETKLPVRIEKHGLPITNHPGETMTFIQD